MHVPKPTPETTTIDFINDLFLQLTELATGAETWQQIGVLLLAGAIPFIESYLGSFLGVLLGIPPALAVTASVIGKPRPHSS